MTLAITGLENRVTAASAARATPPPLGVRLTRDDWVVESSCDRHGFAPNRLRLIAAVSGLMTESAGWSSGSMHVTTSGSRVGVCRGWSPWGVRRSMVKLRSTNGRCVDGEPRIPMRYSTRRSLSYPRGGTHARSGVHHPPPCPTSFRASGRPERSTSRAGDSVPASRSPWPGTRRRDSDGAGRAPPARARSAATRHGPGECRRPLPGIQVGCHRAPAAGGLHVGALHGSRLACLTVGTMSAFGAGTTRRMRKFRSTSMRERQCTNGVCAASSGCVTIRARPMRAPSLRRLIPRIRVLPSPGVDSPSTPDAQRPHVWPT